MSLTSRRLDLQSTLESILGSRNVYFQPPASIHLSYPCFVYSFEGGNHANSDNVKYLKRYRFEVTLITKDPLPEEKMSEIEAIPYCRFNRSFVSDNLNHFAYTINLEERT